MSSRPLLALTLGDINGIGPEILTRALARRDVRESSDVVVAGNVSVLEEARRRFAPACPPFQAIDGPSARPDAENGVGVVEGDAALLSLRPGTIDAEAGRAAVAWLQTAVRWALAGEADAVVTCPINKQGIHAAGYAYPGHTEVLAEMTNTTAFRMSLFAGPLRVVHNTAHLPIRAAIDALTPEGIAESARIADDGLARLGLQRRRIAVAGLNPHAGEGGHIGTEDQAIIEPAVALAREDGLDVTGPVPPDTVFRRMWDGEFDIVVAMYHDQGHIPVKLVAMDEGVNVTLGIPIVRTSVDHGTAYDIAWQGVAREHSLVAAMALAAQFATGARV